MSSPNKHQDSSTSSLFQLLRNSGVDLLGSEFTQSWFDNKSDIISWQTGMIAEEGFLGCCGAVYRMGRGAWKTLVEQQAVRLGITTQDFRFLPFTGKVQILLMELAGFLDEMMGSKTHVLCDNQSWQWKMEEPPTLESSGRENRSLLDFFIAGLLQESISWADGGKNNFILELATENNWSYKILRSPID